LFFFPFFFFFLSFENFRSTLEARFKINPVDVFVNNLIALLFKIKKKKKNWGAEKKKEFFS
jgi:hypothetical protein